MKRCYWRKCSLIPHKQAQVGELAWASVATACSWHNRSSGETLRLYDPLLTERGVDQVWPSCGPESTSTNQLD